MTIALMVAGKMNGKGSKRRPCNEKKVAANWPFAERKIRLWQRDKNGKLK